MSIIRYFDSPEILLKEYSQSSDSYPYVCVILDDKGLIAMFVDDHFLIDEMSMTAYPLIERSKDRLTEADIRLLESQGKDRELTAFLVRLLGIRGSDRVLH